MDCIKRGYSNQPAGIISAFGEKVKPNESQGMRLPVLPGHIRAYQHKKGQVSGQTTENKT
jgi:hypothetical protein